MALNTADQFYLAEKQVPSVNTLGQRLCRAYARPADAFGHRGNTSHVYGYHRSRAWILRSPDSAKGSRDYSIQRPKDRGGDENNVCAFDFTPAGWGSAENRARMVEITTRLYHAALASDERLSALVEVAGTFDGKNVVTFLAQGGGRLTPFDSSHLDHIHGSFWRSLVDADHLGIFHVMTGVTAGIAPRKDEPMFLASPTGSGVVCLTNGLQGRWVSSQELPHIVALHSEGTAPLTFGGKVREVAFQSLVGEIQGTRPPGWGKDVDTQEILDSIKAIPTPAVTWTDEQVQHLADAIIAAPNNGLTDAERADVVAAVKQATREGSGA